MSYQGWKNYETWAVNLHMRNDPGIYEYVRETAVAVSKDWKDLADEIKNFIEENVLDAAIYEIDGDRYALARDLLTGAFQAVDFDEIARGYIEDFGGDIPDRMIKDYTDTYEAAIEAGQDITVDASEPEVFVYHGDDGNEYNFKYDEATNLLLEVPPNIDPEIYILAVSQNW